VNGRSDHSNFSCYVSVDTKKDDINKKSDRFFPDFLIFELCGERRAQALKNHFWAGLFHYRVV